MKIEPMNKPKKKEFIESVGYLGLEIEDFPWLLIKGGIERVNTFSGSLSVDEILEIWKLLPIEGIGLYIGKEISDKKTGVKETRLSLDALHFLKNKIGKNIIVLDEKQEENWFKGRDIELNEEQEKEYSNISGFVAVCSSDKYKDFLGTGKISFDKKRISCFLPKERRIRS
jgi:NOL1/NOP2/fmu family ribosome biogenesis protein